MSTQVLCVSSVHPGKPLVSTLIRSDCLLQNPYQFEDSALRDVNAVSFGKFARGLERASIRREVAQWSAFVMCIVDALLCLFFMGMKLGLPYLVENSLRMFENRVLRVVWA
jgi:hypothetical protein